MDPVPNNRAGVANDIAGYRCQDEERDRGNGIERFDHIDWLNHVRPENKIDQGLRPAGGDQSNPQDVPSANECRGGETGFVWINHGERSGVRPVVINRANRGETRETCSSCDVPEMAAGQFSAHVA